jgi:hypothetical protein
MIGPRVCRAVSCAGWIVLASTATIGRPVRADAPTEGLWSRLRRIETAFRGGDAISLRRSFASGGKVRVDLRDLEGGSGVYSPGQLQVMFGRIFDESPTRDFGFRPDDVTTSSDTAFARGRWVRRQPGGDRVETLTFTLHAESGDWRILEIRATR